MNVGGPESRGPQPDLRKRSAGVYIQYNVARRVQGNLIGTDATVSYSITNGNGILVQLAAGVQIGGPGANEGNVIGGSLAEGFGGTILRLPGQLRREPIRRRPRTSATSAAASRSTRPLVRPTTGILGGMGPGEGNVIAHNGGGGIFGDPAGFIMPGSTGQVTARGNRFYDNRPVAIALGFDPPHPADPGDGDMGPNGRQNAPVITSHRLRPAHRRPRDC